MIIYYHDNGPDVTSENFDSRVYSGTLEGTLESWDAFSVTLLPSAKIPIGRCFLTEEQCERDIARLAFNLQLAEITNSVKKLPGQLQQLFYNFVAGLDG